MRGETYSAREIICHFRLKKKFQSLMRGETYSAIRVETLIGLCIVSFNRSTVSQIPAQELRRLTAEQWHQLRRLQVFAATASIIHCTHGGYEARRIVQMNLQVRVRASHHINQI